MALRLCTAGGGVETASEANSYGAAVVEAGAVVGQVVAVDVDVEGLAGATVGDAGVGLAAQVAERVRGRVPVGFAGVVADTGERAAQRESQPRSPTRLR